MKEKINPSIGNNPLMLLLTAVMPQLILILFRLWTLTRIRLEIAPEETVVIYSNYIVIPILLTLAGSAAVWWTKWKSEKLGWLFSLGLFLLHSASLIYFLFSLGDGLFPVGVDQWIVPQGPFVMLQLAAAMPAIFYSLLCLANVRLSKNIWVSVLTGVATLVLTPTLFYCLTIFSFKWSFFKAIPVVALVLGTAIAAFAFLQLLLWLSIRMKMEWISILVFGLVFPLSGLALNHMIPFPATLQHWGFYMLTVLNAAILLWGCRAKTEINLLSGLATAASYPFTCYFFFLFLPFLPFSLLAMIAAGSGFLILTPTVLFILHTRRLMVQGKALAARHGMQWIITAFIIAFLLVPGLYVGRAVIHRQIFRQVLDQVYTPDFKTDRPMPSPRTSRYVLNRMIQMKRGVYVPILSECYNRIVFDGMVLPDRKMNELSLLLLGKKMEAISIGRDREFYSWFTGEDRRSIGRNVRKPKQSVTLTDVTCSSVSDAGLTETSVLLNLVNDANRQAEFSAELAIPDGVFISGYELKIGDEMVPGRISDRKAALWVYHMIRDDARRDPGLLVYTGPNSLSLSVYPFESNQHRQCLIRFLYPEGSAPEIRIGERAVQLSSDNTEPICLIERSSGGQALYISHQAAKTYSPVVRKQEFIYLTGDSETAGFCPEWQVKRELLNYFQSGSNQVKNVPVFITQTGKPTVEFDGAAYWLPHIPDGGWQKPKGQPIPETAIILFRSGEQIKAVSADEGGLLVFDGNGPIERFDPAQDQFVPFSATCHLPGTSRYSQTIDLMQQWWETQLAPNREELLRISLLQQSQALNVLIPSTAFIAVENTAQEQALKDAEKKSLKSHTALEFDEFDSPEPGVILMMVCLLPLMVWMQKRQEKASRGLQK